MGWSRQITKLSTYLLPILSDDILIMSMPNFIHVCRRSSVIKIDIVGEKLFQSFVTNIMFMSIFVYVPAVFSDINRHLV